MAFRRQRNDPLFSRARCGSVSICPRVEAVGYSSTNLGLLYMEMVRGMSQTSNTCRGPSTRSSVDEAQGNAEALLVTIEMGLKIAL
jgi:hypothetical protein